MRLIDADELLFELTHWKDNKGWYHDTRTDIYHISVIKTVCDRMPNIDAIPVIRCKDCKWCENFDTDGIFPNWFCKNWYGGTDSDGYCHEAERREE